MSNPSSASQGGLDLVSLITDDFGDGEVTVKRADLEHLTARLRSLERLREMAGALVESWGDNTDPRREPTVENDLRAALADSEEGRDDHMPDRDPEETGSKSSSREGQ